MALEQFAIVVGAVLGFWTGFFTRDSTYPRAYMQCIAPNGPSGQSEDQHHGGYLSASSSFQAFFWAWVGSPFRPHRGYLLLRGGSRRPLLLLRGSACVRGLKAQLILCSRYERVAKVILQLR